MFAAIAAGTPGPANVLVTATGAAVGAVRGTPCLLGVSIGTGALLDAVALGLGTLVLSVPALLLIMKVAGAALLLWLSWQIASAPPPTHAGEHEPVGFFTAAALQWVNPKSWMIAVSAAATYPRTDDGSVWLQGLWFAGLFTLVAVPAVGVWLVFGAGVQHLITSEGGWRIFNTSMGCLLAASVLFVFL